MSEPKYIFTDGVMELNPKHPSYVNKKASQEIAVVSSMEDIGEASVAQQEHTGQSMKMSKGTQCSIEIMQDSDYTSKLGNIDGGAILDGLTAFFARYEVPIGLINKLHALTEFRLNFIIDDSGSMNSVSDEKHGDKYITRWDEVKDRIHVLIDMLAYIPFEQLEMRFLNKKTVLKFSHKGRTPEAFAADVHKEIDKAMAFNPSGCTPLSAPLRASLASPVKTMHYIFTDGEPDNLVEVKGLVNNRNTQLHPITFISCTSDDDSANWMKEIEESSPWTAEIDDYISERKEVLHDQGPAFPFTKGFWLICLLCAAINPGDLDALDESTPLTKFTFDNLMGRETTPQEYEKYWKLNPNSGKFHGQYNAFSTERKMIITPPAYSH